MNTQTENVANGQLTKKISNKPGILALAATTALAACQSNKFSKSTLDFGPLSFPTPAAAKEVPGDKGAQSNRASSSLDRLTMPQEPMQQKPTQNSQEIGPREYEHMISTDVHDKNSFWYTHRNNIIGTFAARPFDPLKIINTDRPDFTDVATTVGNGVTQVESGFLHVRRRDSEISSVTETAPNVLMRYGVGDDFEFRVKTRGYVHNRLRDNAGATGSTEGVDDVELGFKYVLGQQQDLVPMESIVVRLGVPVGSSDVSANRFQPGISYIYNWQVREWWFFRGATGVDAFNQPAPVLHETSPGMRIPRDNWLEISQAVSSYFQISERVGSFVEWFMLKRHGSNDDRADHFHNYGLYLYLTPSFQLDGRIGWRFGEHVDQSFWGAGVSLRF